MIDRNRLIRVAIKTNVRKDTKIAVGIISMEMINNYVQVSLLGKYQGHTVIMNRDDIQYC